MEPVAINELNRVCLHESSDGQAGDSRQDDDRNAAGHTNAPSDCSD
jgi:hypothetical protein